MKYGRTLQQLAEEITRQKDAKRDFLVPAARIEGLLGGDGLFNLGFPINSGGSMWNGPLNDNGHSQLAEFAGIPSKYYQKMLGSSADLLIKNVNHWMQGSTKNRMVRTLDGNVRALLSDSYRRLDNFDLANEVLPMLAEVNAEIKSCEITENRLYIKAITEQVQTEVKPGDIVSAGVIVSNSETGNGSLSIKPLVYRLVCSNGAIVDDFAHKQYHVGRIQKIEEFNFSNETLAADDKAFWLKIRDLVKYTLEETTFDKIVNVMREATYRKIEDPANAIELVTKKHNLLEGEKKNVLNHLITGGDLSSWGLGNAVTRAAQDVESYDRSTELEGIGYQIMQNDWNGRPALVPAMAAELN